MCGELSFCAVSPRASGKQKLLPKSKGKPPPDSQLLALSHALAAPLHPLFKIGGVEAMKGGWEKSVIQEALKEQFW